MQVLKPEEVKSIEQFFQLKQETLLKLMYKYLKSKYDTVYCTKEYIMAIGDIPVALVAHLDTVFHNSPEDIFYDRIKNVMWSPDGLGADDRAGVYSIVQILKQGLKPTVIFTTDEEKGGIGASALIKAFPTAPTDLKYIIELDRRGCMDCVFYECDNSKFEDYVESFGFVTAWGTFTDISIICPVWEVAGVNLSIGYESEHSHTERLYIGHMLVTIKKVIKMLEATKDLKEKFEYIPMAYEDYLARLTGWDPSYGISQATWNSWYTPTNINHCRNCDAHDYDYNLFPIKGLYNNTIFLCGDCFAAECEKNSIGWCKHCNDAYVIKPDTKDIGYCYDCQEKGDLTPNEVFYTAD